MKIRVHAESVAPMLAACSEARSQGFFDEEALRSILDHPDYVFERNRYGERLPLDAFVRFLQSLARGTPDDQGVGDIGIRVSTWQRFWADMEVQAAAIDRFVSELTPEYLDGCAQIALDGLPADHAYEDVDFVFTLGYGGSLGYVHEGTFACDALSFVQGGQSARSTIAHETHHLLLEQLPASGDDSPLHAFLCVFVGEGLACKYCNNIEGVISRRLDPRRPVDMSSDWAVFHAHFAEDFREFREQFAQVREGRCKTRAEVWETFAPMWRRQSAPEWWEDQHEYLDYQPHYYMGSQIFGVIHDAFGKDTVYEAFFDSGRFASVFNAACKKMGISEAYRLPE